MSIRIVGDTIADAVRVAVSEGVGDFWRNKLEVGSLKSALVRNEILSPVEAARRADDLTMRAAVSYGRVKA
jgi:hypothetical protein